MANKIMRWPLKQGKPVERRRRKVSGLPPLSLKAMAAEPPESGAENELLFPAVQNQISVAYPSPVD